MSTYRISKSLKTFAHKFFTYYIPRNVEESLLHPQWSQSIHEELKALQKNKTWKLVSLPKRKKIVRCKWVFSNKYNVVGFIDRYKIRLIANGYTLMYGIYYQETFSLVTKLNTLRIFLSHAINLDWPLHQLDFNNAFLHGNLE